MNGRDKILAVGLAGLLALALLAPANWPRPSGAISPDVPSGEVALENTPSTIDIDRLLARPLFEPSRRPVLPPAPVIAAVQEPDPFHGWQLSGTLMLGKGRDIAYLSGQNRDPVKLHVGGDFYGWRVISIDPARITFEKNNIQKALELPNGKNP